MFRMEARSLREALGQLDQARQDHADWHEELIGTLLCCSPTEARRHPDTGDRHCRLGRWYHERAPAELREHPAFAALGTEHHRLHVLGSALLAAAARGEKVSRTHYEELSAASSRLRLELDSLRHEIQAALAQSDTLTGAYGRSALLPELREWHELVKRGVQRCGLAFMDLDHFKEINDTYGHLVGDEVLAGAAQCMARHLRPYDKLFRYGGDEFLVLLPAVDLRSGRTVIERVRRTLASTTLARGPGGVQIGATGSFGLAMLDPSVPVEESVERGDTALLLAKGSGRNRVVTWDPSVETQRSFRRLEICTEVGRASRTDADSGA